MRRPRARAGRATVIGVAFALLLTACGSSGDDQDKGPDAKTSACRGEWKDLGKKVQGNDQKTNPSALAPRWNNLTATIEYYATSAKDSDCDSALEKQEEAIAALTSFGTKLAPYDMELQLEQVRDAAEAYAAGPAPSPSPTPKASKNKQQKQKKKAKQPPAPPSPPSISNAVKTLVAQAPAATEQQGPGWQQASVVDLDDDAAVAKTVKDLAFLSTESPGWRACKAALAQIKLALAAAQ